MFLFIYFQARQRKVAGNSSGAAGTADNAEKRFPIGGQNENNSGSSSTTNSAPGKKVTLKSTLAQKSATIGSSPNRFLVMNRWHFLIGCTCLTIASYFGYVGYLETRVNTPFDDHKVCSFCFRNGLLN